MAWFAFMRGEWERAFAAVREPMAWTGEIWFVWVVITVLLGVAMMAYVAGHARSTLKSSLYAGLVLWLILVSGFTVWGRLDRSFSFRVLALDASVNLVGLLAASLAGAWSLRDT